MRALLHLRRLLTSMSFPPAVQQPQIAVLELEGLLFFGTTNCLVQQVRQRLYLHRQLPNHPPLRYLILDFDRVRDLDITIILSLTKIRQIATQRHIQLLFTHLTPTLQRKLRKLGCLTHSDIYFRTLQQGLTWCTQQLAADTQSSFTTPHPSALSRSKSAQSIIQQLAIAGIILLIGSGAIASILYVPKKINPSAPSSQPKYSFPNSQGLSSKGFP